MKKKYVGTIVGEFTETQIVEAETLEQAIEELKGNTGLTTQRTATGNLEVSDVEELLN